MSFDSDEDDAFLALGEETVTPIKKRKWINLQSDGVDEEEDSFGFDDNLDATLDAYCTSQEKTTQDTVLRCRVLGMEAVPPISLVSLFFALFCSTWT